jgi:hypothetical protein
VWRTGQVGEEGHVLRVELDGLLVVGDGSVKVLLLVCLVAQLLLLQSLLLLGRELGLGFLGLLLGLGRLLLLGLLLLGRLLWLRGLLSLGTLNDHRHKHTRSDTVTQTGQSARAIVPVASG